MTNRLEGRVALITGAAGGIGAATARRFVEEGARVVLADINPEPLAALEEELGDNAKAVECDVAVSEEVGQAVDTGAEAFGGVDIVFNNAVVGWSSPVAELKEEVWQRLLRVNVGGVINGIRHGARAMQGRGGVILNTSSFAAHHALAGLGLYGACKSAVEALTRTAAYELRAEGIRVNAIVPGMIRTPAAEASADLLATAVGGDLDAWIAAYQERWGTAEDVANVAVHLASDEAAFTSGLLYHVDNGANTL